ncbi:hypothetical protein E6W39_06720 [Kitasatospora acidiphila]|uniref:Uncharacterized protein n=2 Tax=Kitasatospora acidiphila TaxID=2567942 RepID=A0A540WE59_9ACTN|nr:hypothetical protein E6W39_06720 [Kitasatospora acidiphila]
MAALARKIRSTGRPWTMGDTVMVADGQWAVRTESWAERAQVEQVRARVEDGQRVELTVEELARAVGAADPGAHRDPATD